jgi:hypothetical protein
MKNIEIWGILSKYLDEGYKNYVLDKFEHCYDFSPNKHWEKYIADLIVIMKHHEEWNTEINYLVVQVKSKFGLLCFYVDNSDDFLRGAIKSIELQCSKTCFTCGSYGEVKRGTSSAFKKYCSACYSNRIY